MPTGLANEDEYFELIRGDLEDAVGARARLEPRPQSAAYRRPSPLSVSIRVPGGRHVVVLSRRSPVFSSDEARLLSSYARALQEFGDVPRVFATTASEDVLTRAIAVRCSDADTQAAIVEKVIQAMVRHATATYEGTRVAVNVCLDLDGAEDGTPLAAFFDQPWASILGSGLNSAVLLGRDGSVQRILQLAPVNTASVLAPEPFAPLAAWTKTEGRVALSIARSGEIYLFRSGELLLVRRNSRWRAFPLAPLLSSGWFGTSERKLAPTVKQAILSALLDASAAHHGACLGVLHHSDVWDGLSNLVAAPDRWSAGDNSRRRMFDHSNFLQLSRRHRLEMLSMDGATLLDQAGNILAAGAILRVGGGSVGGGRTAAAHAITTYGLGIKVSQDGPVIAYVRSSGQVVPHFAMG